MALTILGHKMNAKDRLIAYAEKHNIKFKKIIIFQDLKFFFYPSLCLEKNEIKQLILLVGKRNGSHEQRHNGNPEKIAIFISLFVIDLTETMMLLCF